MSASMYEAKYAYHINYGKYGGQKSVRYNSYEECKTAMISEAKILQKGGEILGKWEIKEYKMFSDEIVDIGDFMGGKSILLR